MNLLLDTQVVLWTIDGSLTSQLPALSRSLQDTKKTCHVSAASLWEINIKHGLGKLRLDIDLGLIPNFLESQGLVQLPISVRHVLARPHPEPPTRDPFDRLLLMQAQVENMKLVTVDRLMIDHPAAFQP